jgi:RNase adaptor protein for sRNA GlmZ degradation
VAAPGPAGRGAPPEGTALTVRVGSFSFRRGYPPDETGHGGPIFDCRVLPNPGRLEAYRRSSGLDEAVTAFLEEREETGRFWELVRPLAEAQVREFLDRGHAELTIHFGCTGGQHRSPYFAERLARHLREEFPEVRVEVVHREREGWPETDATSWRR